MAAEGLGELVDVTSEAVLKPFVVPMTGEWARWVLHAPAARMNTPTALSACACSICTLTACLLAFPLSQDAQSLLRKQGHAFSFAVSA